MAFKREEIGARSLQQKCLTLKSTGLLQIQSIKSLMCLSFRAVSVYMVKSPHFSFPCLDPSTKILAYKNTERILFLLLYSVLRVYFFL